MGKSLTDVAKEILMKEETSNASTLKPKSKSADAPQTLGSATKIADAPVKSGEGSNVGSAAAAPVKKDSSKPTQGAKPAEPAKKISKEVMEEDINLDEEEQLDEISSELAGRAAFIAKNRAETAENEGKNRKAQALQKQSDRLYDAAERKANQENNRDNEISSGKRAKMEEEIEISEELAAFIEEKLAEGLTEEEIAMAIDENFEFVTEESEAEEVVAEETEEEYQVDMSEHVEALFAGEELSEDFKQKALTIFESAVKQKVQEELKIIEASYAETLEEQVDQIKQELTENVDDYLNYVVEQWVSDNEVAITEGLRTELTEDFISGLRNLFTEHYIDIPEDKVSVVEEMGKKVEELETKLNEEIQRSVQLNKMLNETKTEQIIDSICEGLTDTQVVKIKSLIENVEFTTVEEFSKKVNTLRESYFPTKIVSENALDTNTQVSEDGREMISEELTGPMAKYVSVLGKTLPK